MDSLTEVAIKGKKEGSPYAPFFYKINCWDRSGATKI